ncbi:battenin-like [Chrysoperla carnea]|uniref:battenin-like n=1 Tax=Chrysoperla carnea TaxID=189513 RepID=UPI001D06F558|nr:battenin-like [Chrysoperla carnea]XP_044737688.1 battenin-like [Chrysoperla carnea]
MVDGVGIMQENDPNKQKLELFVIDLGHKNQIECLKENDNKSEKDDATRTNNKNNEFESAKLRDYIAFWLLACCNNFGYTLLLTAAHDILKDSGDFTPDDINDATLTRDCNLISTGTILLADSLPGLLVKVIAPFIPASVHIRMVCVVSTYSLGLLLVAFSKSVWVAIIGTAITSLSGGLGEVTCLSHSPYFPGSVLGGWASGNAAAGLIGSFALASFTFFGLSARQTVLIAICIPVVMAITFWCLLSKVDKTVLVNNSNEQSKPSEVQKVITPTTRKEKLKSLPTLLQYMIPIFLIYFFQYFINQGLIELVQFDSTWIDHSAQYRWIQVVYQIGKFIAQSSREWIKVEKVWILVFFQFLNVIVFLNEVLFYILPYLPIVFVFAIWEGFVGGLTYVNIFRQVRRDIPSNNQDFALVMTSLSDSCGIASSGFISITIHNLICQLPKPTRWSF